MQRWFSLFRMICLQRQNRRFAKPLQCTFAPIAAAFPKHKNRLFFGRFSHSYLCTDLQRVPPFSAPRIAKNSHSNAIYREKQLFPGSVPLILILHVTSQPLWIHAPVFFSFVGAGHARPAHIRQTVICGKIEGGSAFIFLQPYPPLKLRRSALYTGRQSRHPARRP